MNQKQANELAATILHEIQVTSHLQYFFGSKPIIRVEPSPLEVDTDEPTESSPFFVTVASNGNTLAASADYPNNPISSRSFSSSSEWEKLREEIVSVDEELLMIDALSSLEGEMKRLLKTQIVRHQFLLSASLRIRNKRFSWVRLGYFYVFSLVGSLVSAPFLLQTWTGGKNFIWNSPINPVFTTGAFVILFFILISYAVTILFGKIGQGKEKTNLEIIFPLGWLRLFSWPTIIVCSYVAIVFAIIFFLRQNSSHTFIFDVVVAALLGVAEFTTIVLMYALLRGTVIARRNFSQSLMALLIWDLIHLLYLVEQSHGDWVELEYKQRQMALLELAAICIEKYLPLQLPSGDALTDLWWRERTRQIAGALREKKKWILTPTNLTYNDFVDKMAHALICLITGDWDALERCEPEKLPRLSSWRTISVTMLRTVLLAALPIIGFWIFQQTPLALTDPARGYVSAGVFIWIVLTCLTQLDPNISARISAFKDVVNLVNLLQPPKSDPKP